MYEFILERGIGSTLSQTYETIAKYFERDLLHLRQADKVYRDGLDKCRTFNELEYL